MGDSLHWVVVHRRRVLLHRRSAWEPSPIFLDLTRPGTEVRRVTPVRGVAWYDLLGLDLSGPGSQPQPYLRYHLEREYQVWYEGRRFARLKQVAWYAPGTRCWYAAMLVERDYYPGTWERTMSVEDHGYSTHPVGVGRSALEALEDLWEYRSRVGAATR